MNHLKNINFLLEKPFICKCKKKKKNYAYVIQCNAYVRK